MCFVLWVPLRTNPKREPNKQTPHQCKSKTNNLPEVLPPERHCRAQAPHLCHPAADPPRRLPWPVPGFVASLVGKVAPKVHSAKGSEASMPASRFLYELKSKTWPRARFSLPCFLRVQPLAWIGVPATDSPMWGFVAGTKSQGEANAPPHQKQDASINSFCLPRLCCAVLTPLKDASNNHTCGSFSI